MNNTYHLISHTHWDREWYEPFEKFRIRLIRLIDNLLSLVEREPGYVFHLDAQTVVLEDYLEIKPRQRERLRKAISGGNILIGPWYVQNDLFLSGGEATIRNLLRGRRLVREFGSTSGMIAYTPDHFGNPSQLPQLAAGFGLDSVVFGRGRCCTEANGRKAEFIWEGADGTRVLAVQMVKFYNNAQRFSDNPRKASGFFELARTGLAPLTATHQYLLMNGVDHLEAQENLLEILPVLRDVAGPGAVVKQSTLHDFCAAVREELTNPEIHHGEMREGSDRIILQGTLSSRVYLKVANVRAENFLARQLEPLNTMLLMLPFSHDAYDREILDHLWKLLIINQPHDSICGCSCDAVHRHMEDRFERFNECGALLMTEKLRLLASHIQSPPTVGGDDYYVLAVNTLPWDRSAMIEAVVDLKASEKIDSFILLDEDGCEIPYARLKREFTERPLRSPINLPGRMEVERHLVRFSTTLPATGYRTFTIRPGFPIQPAIMGGENEFLKLTVRPDGRIDLFDKREGRMFSDLLYLEDSADFGDSYTYSPDPNAEIITSHSLLPEVTCLNDNAVESVFKLRYELDIPASVDFSKRKRETDTKPVTVEITLMLRIGSPYLEIAFSVDNQAKDHCLRAVFRTGIDGDVTLASGMFDVIPRNRHAIRPEPANDRQEPVFEFVKLQNPGQGGATLLVEGLHAYEHYRDREGEIGITLLRANGYIQGYFERPRDSDWLAPENQCLRTVNSRLAFMPGKYASSTEIEARAAIEFLNPPLSCSDSWDRQKFSGGRPCVQDSELSEIFHRPDPYPDAVLPPSASLCRIDDPAMIMTAFKQAEDGNGVVLRFYNTSTETRNCRLSFSVEWQKIELCRLDETAIQLLTPLDRQISVRVKPKTIVTLKCQ